MAVIARDQITLSWQLDIKQTIYYYKKQSSTSAAPAKPTSYPPTGWSTTEPSYSTGETSTLYVTVCTIFSDNTYEYSDVTVSSSFEAAKAAYNKAAAAEGAANNAMTAANGKNKIFYQDAAPASGMSEGDLWFDTDGGNAIHEYKKTSSNPDTYAWVLRQFGTGSLAAGSVTANEINVNNLAAISAYLGNAVLGGSNNASGSLTIKNASGTTIGSWNNSGIDATAGVIGGWSIGSAILSSSVTIDNVDHETLMQSLGTSTDLARVAFAVRTKASSATTWTYPFIVRHNGKLKATDADITGKITADSGTIGGWNVDTASLYKLTADENYRIRLQSPASPTTGNYVIRLDQKENNDWTNLFHLSYGGALYAKNATITGSVTSTSTDGIQKTTITGGTASFYYDNTLAGQFVTNRFIYHEPPAPDITYNTVTLLGGSTSSRAAEIRIQPANSRGSSDTYIDIRNLANYVPSEYRDIASNAFPEIFVHARNTLISGEYVGLLGAFLSTTESIHAGKDIETYGHFQAIHYDTSEVQVKVQNNLHNANLTVNNAGLFCLYSVTNQHILIQDDTNGVVKVRCPNGMYRPVGTTDTDGSRVGAFQTPSATTLRVYAQKGTAGASYGGYITFTGTSSSDIRLKKNIKSVEVKALPLINAIEMKSFDWISGQREFTHQPIGMIADQIEKLDSRLTIGGGYDSDGTPNYKVIDDHYLICYLTKAVQELSAELERMKAS